MPTPPDPSPCSTITGDKYKYYKETCSDMQNPVECSTDCVQRVADRNGGKPACYKPAQFWCACQGANHAQVSAGYLPTYCNTPNKLYTWRLNGPRTDCLTQYEPDESKQKTYTYCMNSRNPEKCLEDHCLSEALACNNDATCVRWLECLERGTSPSQCPGAQSVPARNIVDCAHRNECPIGF